MKSLISRLAPRVYTSNYEKYLRNSSISKEQYYEFLQWSFKKSYKRFNPIRYLPGNNFQKLKILYGFLALESLSQLTNKSIKKLCEEYTWELKDEIRNQALGLKLNELSKSWGKENVALWNSMNTIKFQSRIFNSIPLFRADVLDFGCSIGGASFLASTYNTKSHTVTDVPGFALDVAERSLQNLGVSVEKVPILNPADPPIYSKKFDVIFCIHVFEHTYDPIKTCKNLLNSLKSGGTFIYTYYKASAPDGYNTVEGLEKRDEVLNLILQKTYPTSISNLKPYSIVKKI